MATRETKVVKTPNGHEAAIYSYVTAGDQRHIQAVLLSGMKIKAPRPGEKPELPEFDGQAMMKSQEAALERMVCSLDGSRSNVLTRLLELKPEDFQVILEAVEAITNKAEGDEEAEEEKKG